MPSHRTTIVIIDPSKEDRDYWVQRLHASWPDIVVLEAATGTDGLTICRSQHVDCVITELTLPDMSGFEVLLKLVHRPLYPERAVVFLSSTSFPEMGRLALNNGAQAYLIKTAICGDQLDQVIRKAIAAVNVKGRHRGRWRDRLTAWVQSWFMTCQN